MQDKVNVFVMADERKMNASFIGFAGREFLMLYVLCLEVQRKITSLPCSSFSHFCQIAFF